MGVRPAAVRAVSPRRDAALLELMDGNVASGRVWMALGAA